MKPVKNETQGTEFTLRVAKMQHKVREMVRKAERQFKLITRARMADMQFRVGGR